jgi:hypothetical protein
MTVMNAELTPPEGVLDRVDETVGARFRGRVTFTMSRLDPSDNVPSSSARPKVILRDAAIRVGCREAAGPIPCLQGRIRTSSDTDPDCAPLQLWTDSTRTMPVARAHERPITVWVKVSVPAE